MAEVMSIKRNQRCCSLFALTQFESMLAGWKRKIWEKNHQVICKQNLEVYIWLLCKHGTVTEVIVLNHIHVMLYGGEHTAYQSLTLRVFCYHPIIYQSTHMSHLMTKPTKWHVCPAKTLIRLGGKSRLIWVFGGAHMPFCWFFSRGGTSKDLTKSGKTKWERDRVHYSSASETTSEHNLF